MAQDPDHLCDDVDRRLSLSGIPPFSGYWSKDTIIDADWASGTAVGRYAWCLGILAAFMTAFYISRVMFMTFHGEPRADDETHAPRP